MKEITIHGAAIANAEQLHQQLAEQLDFPAWYGNNLDALWDMLEGWIELPVLIRYEYAVASEAEVQPGIEEPGIEAILSLLDEASSTIEGFNFERIIPDYEDFNPKR
jgi:ribonuclease inhibitor